MSSKGLAAFIAGFGASYLHGRDRRDEKERADRREKREEERYRKMQERLDRQEDRENKRDAQEDAVSEGLQKATQLQPGKTLTAQDGTQYATDEGSFQDRLMQADPSIDPEAASQAAKVYSQRAQEPEAASWLDKGFDGTRVKPTTEADVVRAQGAAYAQGGARYADKAFTAQREAAKLDLKDLQTRLLKANNIDELSTLYDEIDDGRSVHAEDVDGKYVVYTKDEDTGRTQLVGKYKDFNEYRDELVATMNNDPEATLNYLSRERQRREMREDREADNKRMDERYAAEVDHRDRVFAAQQQHQRVLEGNAAAQLQLQREKHQADLAKEQTEGNLTVDDKGRVKPGTGVGAGGKVDTGTLTYLNKTADDVAQEVAAVLDSKGEAKFKVGKNKYTKVRTDDFGNEIATSASYVVNPKLQKHAYTLIEHGVPKAEAVRLLTERKKVGGRMVYANMGKATVAGPDGKPQVRWGFLYNGKLIPLE